MPNKIKPKRSYTASSVPLTTDLEAHELAINWADGVAYTKNASGQIVSVTLGGSGGGGGSGLSWASVPASATATGTAGQIAYDGEFFYVATATNTWKRTALATWSIATLDDYFANVSMLLHMNGSNGSTTFTDSSNNAYAVTAFGDAAVSTAQAKFGQSCRLDGTGDYLRVPVAAVSIAANTPFAVEMWIYLTTAQSGYMMLLGDDNAGASSYLAISSTGLEAQFGVTAATLATCTQSFSQNTWYHIAVSRDSSNVVRMYVDGTSKTVTQGTQGGAFLYQGTYGFIGAWGYTTDPYRFNGYIDDVRITDGTARGYTGSTITVPTAAFPDAGPWTPSTIGGLQLWLDASDASTLYDATSGGSLVAADGGVARWEDKSGNARHATQGTSANRPLRKASVQGGKDVLRFDGSNDSLSISGSASAMKFLHSADSTVFMVLSRPAGGYQPLLGTGDTGTATVGFNWYLADGSSNSDKLTVMVVRGVSATNVLLQSTANAFLPSGFSVLSHVCNPTNATAANRSSLRRNGGTAVAGNASTSAVSTANSSYDLKIAGDNYSGGETFSAFDCSEIIIYDSALSDTDREAVENYLLAKWGI